MLVGAYKTLGRLYAQLGNYEKARASYQQSLRINPQQSDVSEGLAKVDLSDAIRNVAESPSAQGYLRLGQVFEQQGRPQEAEAAYKQAIGLDPKLEQARNALKALQAGGK
jgi:cytochrome c-type biogenesis protein CcmH/NrfG